MSVPTKIVLDEYGNIIKSFYIAESKIYGTKLFATLDEAKLFVTREPLPKVLYAFYDFKDEKYYAFTAYEAFNLSVC